MTTTTTIAPEGCRPTGHYTDQERRDRFATVLAMRYGPFDEGHHRATWAEIARRIGVSRQTLLAWRETADYRAAERAHRTRLREEARTDAAAMGDAAVQHIFYLMTNARSDFVQLEAAKTIVAITNLDKELEEQKVEGNKQLVEFQKLLLKKKRDAEALRALGIDPESIVDLEVGPGGRLPQAVVVQNELVAMALRQRHEEDEEPDGEL
jgi:transposase-like protein